MSRSVPSVGKSYQVETNIHKTAAGKVPAAFIPMLRSIFGDLAQNFNPNGEDAAKLLKLLNSLNELNAQFQGKQNIKGMIDALQHPLKDEPGVKRF